MQFKKAGQIVTAILVFLLMLSISACYENKNVDTGDLYIPTFTDPPKPTDPTPENRVLVNIRDEYPRENAYINGKGGISVDAESQYIRIPVEAGQNWFVWYPLRANIYSNYIADAIGAVRFENNQKEFVSYADLAKQPQFHFNKQSNYSGPVIQVPEDAAYMCVNLKMANLYDYSDSAHIMLIDSQFASTWLSIGDSIAEFNRTAHRNWLHLAAEALSANYYNAARSGFGYLAKGGYQKLVEVFPDDQGIDLVTVYGSFNDLCFDYEIGTAEDTYTEGGDNTLAACMNYVYDQIKNLYPNAKIVVISPAPWGGFTPDVDNETSALAKEYVALLEQISKNKGFAFYDLFRESGLKPWVAEENQKYFHDGDACHPNDEGHKCIAEKLIPFLQTVLTEK